MLACALVLLAMGNGSSSAASAASGAAASADSGAAGSAGSGAAAAVTQQVVRSRKGTSLSPSLSGVRERGCVRTHSRGTFVPRRQRHHEETS